MNALVRPAIIGRAIDRPAEELTLDDIRNLPTIRQVLEMERVRGRRKFGRGHPLVRPRIAYEHPDLGDDPQPDPYHAADMALTKRIGARIASHPVYRNYPGWEVIVKHQRHGGGVQIRLQPFMGPINTFFVPMGMIDTDPTLKCVLDACGEILERYCLSRSGFSPDDFIAAIRSKPIHARRHADVPD